MFKLAQVLHCTTNQALKIEDNIYCSPDSKPGLLLGSVKVTFYTMPRISDEYKNEILIDVGFSKYLSVPIKLVIVTTKLSKCLKSGKLLLNIESTINSKLKIKEMSQSAINLNNKLLIKTYSEHLKLKETELYANNCHTLLESTDKKVYYDKLYMFLYLEGDHRRRLVQRYE